MKWKRNKSLLYTYSINLNDIVESIFWFLFHCFIYRNVVVQLLSHVQFSATSGTVTHQDSLSSTNFWNLFRFMFIELVMLILCCSLLLLPVIFPIIRGFSIESALHIRWPKYWTSASVLPVNIQGWFPLGLTSLIFLHPKGLSKSLLQHHNSKASVLGCSHFFMAQLSLLHMTTRKTITLLAKSCLCFLMHCLGLS